MKFIDADSAPLKRPAASGHALDSSSPASSAPLRLALLATPLLCLLVDGTALAHSVPGANAASAPNQSIEAESETADETEEAAAGDADNATPSFRAKVEVRGRLDDLVGIASSSSEGVTGRDDLVAIPAQRAGELVETVPGMVATQHSGDGKANQYFVRGFNLDHGTDFRITVGGLPVNMPSHGHGQGYADMSFVIPELVSRVRFHKGTAHARGGDFSAAGSADFELVNRLPEGFATLTLGSFDYRRAVVAESFEIGQGTLTAAFEGHTNEGPWDRGNDFERLNGFLRYHRDSGLRSFSLTAMTYEGDWLSTDQVPRRAIESGLIDRYGLIDPGPRGDSSRSSLAAQWRWGSDRSLTSLSAYAMSYDLNLVSNFTYLLEDSERGDQFLQLDDRTVFGLDLRYDRAVRLGSLDAEWEFGVEARFDDIDNGLLRTEDLVVYDAVRQDTIDLLGVGAFAELKLDLTRRARLSLGVRADSLEGDVVSDLAINSGTADDVLISPKIALAYAAASHTELYASFGNGFHSNDIRGATIRIDPSTLEGVDPADLLVRGRGWELGVRSTRVPGLQTTLTLYSLELDSELVFVGDGGATEASGRSRRLGVEWANAWKLSPSLTLELDAAWVDAELVDEPRGAREIPGAVDSVVSGALVFRHGEWTAAAKLRAFGGYPLIEDGSVTARDFLGLNARVSRNFGSWSLDLEAFNLLDRDDNDIEYFYASRLPGEPAGGIEDVHLHPVESTSLRLGVTYRF